MMAQSQSRPWSAQSIRESIAPMLAEATAKGLWFYSPYQQLWFSPAKLQAAHDNGRFLWGPENWQLRNPQERVDEARRHAASAQAEADRIAAEVESA